MARVKQSKPALTAANLKHRVEQLYPLDFGALNILKRAVIILIEDKRNRKYAPGTLAYQALNQDMTSVDRAQSLDDLRSQFGLADGGATCSKALMPQHSFGLRKSAYSLIQALIDTPSTALITEELVNKRSFKGREEFLALFTRSDLSQDELKEIQASVIEAEASLAPSRIFQALGTGGSAGVAVNPSALFSGGAGSGSSVTAVSSYDLEDPRGSSRRSGVS